MAISRRNALVLVLTLLGGLFVGPPIGAQTGEPSVDIEKFTDGADADAPPGPTLSAGDAVTWTYVVTNDGELPLTDIVVTDDQGVTVSCPASDLAPAESMTCTGSGLVYLDLYENIGTVTALAGQVEVSDSDPSHYTGTLVCEQSGDHVIFLGGKLANRPGERQSGPFAAPIPAGVYRISATSYDEHSLKTTQAQPSEQWFIELFRPGGLAYTSPLTPDLPETLDKATWTIDPAAVLTAPVDTLFALHISAQQSVSGVNSVIPVCVAFSEVDPEIDIRKQAEGADTRQVVRGSDVTFEIQVTNTGVIDLFNVTVTDPDYPQCDNVIGDLAAGASVTYECVVTNVQADFTNTATVTGDSALSGSATDSDPSTIQALGPAIDIRKQAEGPDARSFAPGSDVTFEIAVTNTGAVDLEGVAVTDPDYPQCDNVIGDLAAGASVTYECVVTDVQANFTNTAAVTGSSSTGEVVADSDPSTITLQELIDLELTKDVDQTLVAPGDQVTFTITTVNQGPGPATGVAVTDALPAGLNYASHGGDGTYDPGTNVWTIGSLAVGESVTLTLTAVAAAPGSYTNEAEVTAANETDVDSVPGDGTGDDWDDASVDVVLVGASSTIGDTVWLDSDGDGIQDAGEPGMSGVTVKLTNTGTTMTQTLVTDAAGKYLFAALDAGTYLVEVDVGTAPADHALTTAGSFTVTLSGDDSFLDADFGFQPDTDDDEELPMTGLSVETFGLLGLMALALGAALLATTRRFWRPQS